MNGVTALILVLYSSSGVGQAIAVPGSLISGIFAGVFAIKHSFYNHKYNKFNSSNEAGYPVAVYKIKVLQNRERALSASGVSVFCLLGAIPVIGGLCGAAVNKKIRKLYWSAYKERNDIMHAFGSSHQ